MTQTQTQEHIENGQAPTPQEGQQVDLLPVGTKLDFDAHQSGDVVINPLPVGTKLDFEGSKPKDDGTAPQEEWDAYAHNQPIDDHLAVKALSQVEVARRRGARSELR